MDLETLYRTLETTLTALINLQGQDTVVKQFSLERPSTGRTLIKIDLQTRCQGETGSEDVAVQTCFTKDTSVSCDIRSDNGNGCPEVKKRENSAQAPEIAAEQKEKRNSAGSLTAKDTKRVEELPATPKQTHEKSTSGFALPWKRAHNNKQSRDSPSRTADVKKKQDKLKVDVHKEPINKVEANKDNKAKPASDVKVPETTEAAAQDEDEDQDVMISQVVKKWSASRGGKRGLF